MITHAIPWVPSSTRAGAKHADLRPPAFNPVGQLTALPHPEDEKTFPLLSGWGGGLRPPTSDHMWSLGGHHMVVGHRVVIRRVSATWTTRSSADCTARDQVCEARPKRRAPGPHVHPLSSHSEPGSFFLTTFNEMSHQCLADHFGSSRRTVSSVKPLSLWSTCIFRLYSKVVFFR